eukprot:scaffold23201_cov65-Phaeocystis_antarctica.AAC.8
MLRCLPITLAAKLAAGLAAERSATPRGNKRYNLSIRRERSRRSAVISIYSQPSIAMCKFSFRRRPLSIARMRVLDRKPLLVRGAQTSETSVIPRTEEASCPPPNDYVHSPPSVGAAKVCDEDIDDLVVRGQLASLRAAVMRLIAGAPNGAEVGMDVHCRQAADDRGDGDDDAQSSSADAALLGGAARDLDPDLARRSPFARLHAWCGAPQPTTSPSTDRLWRSFEEGVVSPAEGEPCSPADTISDSFSSASSACGPTEELSPRSRRATDDHWAMWEVAQGLGNPRLAEAAQGFEEGDNQRTAQHSASDALWEGVVAPIWGAAQGLGNPRFAAAAAAAAATAAPPASPRSPRLTKRTKQTGALARGRGLTSLLAALVVVALMLCLFPLGLPPAAAPPAPAAENSFRKCAELQRGHPNPGTAAALAAVRCVGDEAGRAVLAFLQQLGRVVRQLFKGGRAQQRGDTQRRGAGGMAQWGGRPLRPNKTQAGGGAARRR